MVVNVLLAPAYICCEKIMQHQMMFSQKIFVSHLFYNKYVIYNLPIINIIIIEGSKLNVGDWLKSL